MIAVIAVLAEYNVEYLSRFGSKSDENAANTGKAKSKNERLVRFRCLYKIDQINRFAP
jgi:hypothetical protein